MAIYKLVTIVLLGTSILLWSFINGISLPFSQGTPRYALHPYFAVELLLQISTVFVWAFASLAYFADYRKEGKRLKKDFADHMLLILLILATVIAAVSGVIFYSEPVYLEPLAEDNFLHLPGLNPPSPFALIHGEGLLLCEVLWIFGNLLQLMPKIFEHFQKSA